MKGLLRCSALLALAFAVGCSTTTTLTAVSSKSIDLSKLKLTDENKLGRGQGEDCQHIVIFIPTSGPPSVEEAIDRAVEEKGGNVLLNAVVNYHWFYFPYIYGETCWSVEGDVYDSYR